MRGTRCDIPQVATPSNARCRGYTRFVNTKGGDNTRRGEVSSTNCDGTRQHATSRIDGANNDIPGSDTQLGDTSNEATCDEARLGGPQVMAFVTHPSWVVPLGGHTDILVDTTAGDTTGNNTSPIA